MPETTTTSAPPRAPLLAERTVATLAVLALPWLGAWLPTGLDSIAQNVLLSAGGPLAIGATPWVSGIVLVHLAAAVVPAWRPLLTGGNQGARRLDVASWTAGVVVLTIQLFAMKTLFDGADPLGDQNAWLAALLAFGSLAIMVVARTAHRWTLLSPWVLLAFSTAARETAQAWQRSGTAQPVWPVAAALALVWLPLWAATRPPKTTAEQFSAWLPAPAGTLLTTGWTATLVAFSFEVTDYTSGFADFPDWLKPVSSVAFACCLTAILTTAFHSEAGVQRFWQRLSLADAEHALAWRAIRQALGTSLALTAVLAGLAVLFKNSPALAGRSITLMAICAVLFVADAADAFAAYREQPTLIAIWREPRPFAAHAIVEALRFEGYTAYASGLRIRAALRLFGSFCPLQVLVPIAEAPGAKTWLHQRLAAESVDPTGGASEQEPPLPVVPTIPLSFPVVAMIGMAILGWYLQLPQPTQPLAASILEFLEVDTTFAVQNAPIKECAEFELRSPLPDAPNVQPCVLAAKRESQDAALRRLRDALAPWPAPPGNRWVFEATHDEGERRLCGWLVVASPLVNGDDVAHAAVAQADFGAMQAVVSVEFTEAGAQRLATATARLRGKLLAIVVDGVVVSVPSIREPIEGGRAQISLGSGLAPDEAMANAEALVAKLRR